jgi:hypothetical protein
MTFEERSAWAYALIAITGPIVYFSALFARAAGTVISETPYVDLLLFWAIGFPIVASIVCAILISMIWHHGRNKKDQRDKDIDRHGEYVAGGTLAVSMLVPFGLTLANIDQFWIANAMYLAFVLSALVGAIVKIIAYRRGL